MTNQNENSCENCKGFHYGCLPDYEWCSNWQPSYEVLEAQLKAKDKTIKIIINERNSFEKQLQDIKKLCCPHAIDCIGRYKNA